VSEESEADPKVFVLKRELSEVHLLLDNISSNPDNRLPVTAAEVPAGLDKDWLRKVCEIDWPPAKSDDKAAEACLLIRTKDFLNTLAKPASGATIAFTILVTQDSSKSRRRRDEPDGAAPSRTSLASVAYPDLLAKARRFRRTVLWLSLFLFGWLLLTCCLSWGVSYGNAAIAQLSTAQANYDKAIQSVEGTEVPSKPDTTQSPPRPGAQATPVPVTLRPAEDLCLKARKDLAAAAIGATVYVSVAQLQACETLQQAAFTRSDARLTLAKWLRPFTYMSYMTANPDADYLALANARVSILGNGVLPFCFGMLGAGAAIVRSLSRKMKLSLLTPRDLNLSLQQLALGAVTGACIGLFVAQPGAATAPGTTLGTVALSGSALSFIAGFGVDAVFSTIEGIIQRIFNVAPQPGSPDSDARNQGAKKK